MEVKCSIIVSNVSALYIVLRCTLYDSQIKIMRSLEVLNSRDCNIDIILCI